MKIEIRAEIIVSPAIKENKIRDPCKGGQDANRVEKKTNCLSIACGSTLSCSQARNLVRFRSCVDGVAISGRSLKFVELRLMRRIMSKTIAVRSQSFSPLVVTRDYPSEPRNPIVTPPQKQCYTTITWTLLSRHAPDSHTPYTSLMGQTGAWNCRSGNASTHC